jgi:hypothetical protein
MRPWMKPWRDWAMPDLFSMHRAGRELKAVRYGYEKAGLTIFDQPIPWNAEAVLVEAAMRLPINVPRNKQDFKLRLPGLPSVTPESLQRQEKEDGVLCAFRLPVAPQSILADLQWRNYRLGQITLPVLTRQEFLKQVRLRLPSVLVRLGEHNVACQTFVSTQCRGLTACAVLSSTTSLAPLPDLGLRVEFASERKGQVQSIPVQLTGSQLAEREALVAVMPRRFPRRTGIWTVTWVLADRTLASQRVRAITQKHFHRSLRVTDTRFVIQNGKGKVTLTRKYGRGEETARAGPCFFVSSTEPGMAGSCTCQLRILLPGRVPWPSALDQEILITDGPTMVAPGTWDADALKHFHAFELLCQGQSLGTLPLNPAPAATFTAEGGFQQPPEFSWSLTADAELSERLDHLWDAGNP